MTRELENKMRSVLQKVHEDGENGSSSYSERAMESIEEDIKGELKALLLSMPLEERTVPFVMSLIPGSEDTTLGFNQAKAELKQWQQERLKELE